MTATDADFDVLIVGGGMVGASLACALAPLAWRVGVIEAVPFNRRGAWQPSYDDRCIALAYGSRRIFTGMGLWPRVQAVATPIARIHVSDRGHFGATRLDSRTAGVDALGYVIESRALGEILLAALAATPQVQWLCPARVTHLHDVPGAAWVEVTIEQDGQARTLRAKQVVAADGGKSQIRDGLAIAVRHWDYGQTAIIANVTPQRNHDNVAYERFTRSGPIALLPMREGRCAVVYTVRNAEAANVLALDDTGFLATLQAAFGYRLGRLLRVGARHGYELSLTRAQAHGRGRVALIGNAAHTLHPIAGQGFNLGLRDVAALAEVLALAATAGRDPGDAETLRRYAAWRDTDQRNIAYFTDGLVRLFSNPLSPLAVLRNAGLVALDLCPPAKQMLTRHTMGLAGRLPRLARGLPLQ